jgi:penicillin amidase
MNRFKPVISLILLLIASFSVRAGIMLPGLEAPVTLVRDSNGVPHIYADNEHDLFFMQGRVHAQDRLFQMDLLRRSAAGTLAEVLGQSALQSDVEARTIGLNRAAERSLAAHPRPMLDVLQAYSDGVNSFLDEAEASHQLPPEYGILGLSTVRRWEPLDSVLVGKALAAGTSLIVTDDIDLTIAQGTYAALGAGTGLFDGNRLFFEDLFRSAPFDPASTVLDALSGFESASWSENSKFRPLMKHKAVEQGRDYLKRIRGLPRIPGAMHLDGDDMGGSNSWVVGGQHTPTGMPMLANDIHLQLDSPTLFHEQHLSAPGFKVTGSSLPGAPCVVRGHNRYFAWGVTNARLDVTDIYAEVVVPLGPGQFATVHDGVPEALEVVTEYFSANIGGQVLPIDAATTNVFIVPRRNHGPLITAPSPNDDGQLIALSVQSVGFGPTRDPEGLCAINRAHDLDEFKQALQLVDFASQNFTYADREGNIGYFISGELPLREDLQSVTSPEQAQALTPPFLIRNGYSGNEWLPVAGALPDNQATPFAILPFDEMPQIVNPPSGIIVNSNNDQVGNTLDNDPLNDLREGGTGLLYLNWGGRNFSIRAGRETEMINDRLSRGGHRKHRNAKISFGQMKAMQADTVLNDAKALAPYIIDAYDNARESDADPVLAAIAGGPGIDEAVARLRAWNFTTPTGIAEGYDADTDEDSAANSVATTIYSTWRGTMVANSIDATLAALAAIPGAPPEIPGPRFREEVVTALKHLLDNDGVGASGLNFFNVAGVADAGTRRDILVLVSLADALDLLSSDEFAPVFGNSTNQDDYRWGRLHRIVMKHPLGDVINDFNTPPALGFFAPPLADLDGIPTDGGFETVDEAPPLSATNVRVGDSDSFRFEFGPTGRFVARVDERGIRAETSLPGGESAIPGSPFYLNLLEPYLNNETFRLSVSRQEIRGNAYSIEEFTP